MSNEKNIKDIDRNLKLLVSFKHNFLVGLVRGVGTAIGATIVAGLVVMFLSRLVTSVDDIPIINTIFSSEELRMVLEGR